MSSNNGIKMAADGDRSPVAMLLIDVINDFEFEGGKELASPALTAARNIARLKQRVKKLGVPVIYVNDNFGKWRSDFQKLIDYCLDDETRGKPIVKMLIPEADDYFVLKPRHSAFHATPLELLLHFLGAKTLIVTGFSADNCVLATATDAHMMNYKLIVPEDCVAAANAKLKRHAIRIMSDTLEAGTTKARNLKLKALRKASV